MAVNAGKIQIDLVLGTGTFTPAADRAQAKINQLGGGFRQLGSHGVSAVQATSGALRVLEGGLTNNLRAAERFTANVLGLGPILQKAFPLIGAAAFGGLLLKLGEEASNFFQKMQQAPRLATSAFRSLALEGRVSITELQVHLDSINKEIDKLEGVRHNNLKNMIDEALLAALKLDHALNDTFKTLDKNLEEHKISKPFGLLTGQETTKNAEIIAQQLQDQLAAASKPGDAAIQKARTLAELQAAEKSKAIALQAVLNQRLQDTNRLLNEAANIQKGLQASGQPYPTNLNTGLPAGHMQLDQTANVRALTALRDTIEQKKVELDLTGKITEAERRRTTDEDKLHGQEIDKPIQRVLTELQAKLAESKQKLAAAGLDEAGKALAKGYEDAIAAVARMNEGLERQKTLQSGIKLLSSDPRQSPEGRKALELANDTAANNAEAELKDKVSEVTAKLQDQVKSQLMINDAIGKGWEAQKKVNVEIDLMHTLGARVYEAGLNNPDSLEGKALATERVLALTAAEAKHAAEVAENTRQIQNQAQAERVLAQAQALGVAAVERAALAEEIRQRKSSAAGLAAAEEQALWERFYATRLNKSAEQVAKIGEEIEAIQRLTAAYGQGAEAIRKAELENKVAAINRQGGTAAPGAAGLAGMTIEKSKRGPKR